MSTNKSNHLVNPQAREAMDRFKMEAASQVGVNLTNGYNGELTSRQAGSIGGQMVKKMIEAYEGQRPCSPARRDTPHSRQNLWQEARFRSCFPAETSSP